MIRFVLLAGVALWVSSPALAQDAPAPEPSPAPAPTPPSSDNSKDTGKGDIVITGRLDQARASIQPSLGATTYSISNEAITKLPGGDNQQFNQILLQLPGVVQDGGG